MISTSLAWNGGTRISISSQYSREYARFREILSVRNDKEESRPSMSGIAVAQSPSVHPPPPYQACPLTSIIIDSQSDSNQ